jgi:F0F1-type ATP synthase beta subunit
MTRMATTGATTERRGKVVQVIGPVIDIEFTEGLPEIYNAVRIVSEGGPGVERIDVVAEVEQHLGERLAKFRLANAGGSQKDKGTDRALGDA